ncbi:peptidase S8 [Aeromicrobium chenweiae]|uniref:Peptidase S8 n=2 Tax=Aeromicrobium chenweiae TaxID=2079793 RepID=A0A2S0WRU1_9ACTN|nr:peptidase S8 [Aeromicrobium chenweiae]TGN30744.1 peptidase S8 [Aeromicrobium chenweiae]
MALGVQSSQPAGAAGGAGTHQQPMASTPQRVTLLTGDVVTVTDAGGGRRAATVVPAPGREEVTFQTLEVDGDLQVYPSDAVPYLSSGVLDKELFDVTTLLEDGYADRDELPLIVSWNPGIRSANRSVEGTELTRTLPSLDGAALDADTEALDTVWKALTPGSSAVARTPGAGATGRLSGGIAHVWLDGRAEAVLDRSVAQIGAPDAWKAGYRGKGVEVAVLDTGVDASHPDLVGQVKAAKDFTDSESGTADRFGHGTHVAATIASTGAGADGKYRGVAPETTLLVGKVLGDDGSGYDSGIIAGMQWAADEGAAVVNMSLGGGPSDGTDPLSLALDQISSESGTLFVVAAGNDGGDEDVSTPSTAPSALSVAAVDRDESLAEFSSRGPRSVDGGLKPEISAPGVAIVAARAQGTSMGEPVDALYTASSGTSMATPHVAGAAALLAQQHPAWTGQQLKDALVSTARPNAALGVYEQGAGRVDLTRAVDQQVTATGVADFGLRDDTATPLTRTVTYRNEGSDDITLDLDLSVRNLDDSRAGEGFSAPSRVTVPAGGTAEVDITLDSTKLVRGRWSGSLVATAPSGVSTQTAVGAVRRGTLHTLTVKAIGYDGKDTSVPVVTVLGDQAGSDVLGYLDPGEAGQVQVEEGTYIVQAVIDGGDQQDERKGTVIVPDLHVTSDRTVVLDARKTRPIEIRTPEVSEQQAVISWYTHRVFATGRDIQHGVMSFAESTPWVTPTDRVDAGTFEFSSRWQLVRPSALITVAGSDERPRANLLPESPVTAGARRLELVAPASGMAGVRGKVAVVPAPDRDAEQDQVRAAADAGAKAIILIRPADSGIRTVFRPERDRGPIPAMVTTVKGGAQLLAHARRPGKRQIVLETSRQSPYLYDVMQVSKDAVPDRIVHTVTAKNSHRVTTDYVDNGGSSPWADEQRFGWRPWMTFAWNDASRTVATPSRRVEWVSAGDSIWNHRVSHFYDSWTTVVNGGMTDRPRTYRSGTSTERWYGPVVRPAAVPAVPSTRSGDVMRIQVPEFMDADGHYTVGEATSSRARLFRDDKLLAEGAGTQQTFDVSREPSSYRLALDVTRDDPEWKRGTRTSTEWSFHSARPTGAAAEPLPLLQVDYSVPTDSHGRASWLLHTLKLGVTDQAGAVAKGAKLVVQVSSDDGRTWQKLLVLPTRNGFTAVVPIGTKPVSLRVTATQGTSKVVQEIIRAYDRH